MATEKIDAETTWRQVFSNSAVKGFILIYLIALAIQLYDNVQNAVLLSFLSLICFALIYGAVRLTRGIKVEVVLVHKPLVGVFACALMLVSWFFVDWGFRTEFIPEIVDWELSRFFAQILVFAVIPVVVLNLKGESRQSYGLTLKRWKRGVGISLILGGVLGFLAFFHTANEPILVGQVASQTIFAALPVSFLYFFLRAGFPEELFFRGFLQEHLSFLLKSPLGALVVTSLIFGWAHIPSVIALTPGTSVPAAFAYTTLIQASAGLLFGVLWQRTKSLIPIALIHALPDATSNLMTIIQWLRL